MSSRTPRGCKTEEDKRQLRDMGERIRAVLLYHEISQARFAKNAPVGYTSVSKYVNGTSGISVTSLMKVASALNVSIDWLVYGKDKATPDCIKRFYELWYRMGGDGE